MRAARDNVGARREGIDALGDPVVGGTISQADAVPEVRPGHGFQASWFFSRSSGRAWFDAVRPNKPDLERVIEPGDHDTFGSGAEHVRAGFIGLLAAGLLFGMSLKPGYF